MLLLIPCQSFAESQGDDVYGDAHLDAGSGPDVEDAHDDVHDRDTNDIHPEDTQPDGMFEDEFICDLGVGDAPSEVHEWDTSEDSNNEDSNNEDTEPDTPDEEEDDEVVILKNEDEDAFGGCTQVHSPNAPSNSTLYLCILLGICTISRRYT